MRKPEVVCRNDHNNVFQAVLTIPTFPLNVNLVLLLGLIELTGKLLPDKNQEDAKKTHACVSVIGSNERTNVDKQRKQGR